MKTKNIYRLINPYIEGSINTVVKANNSFDAGKKIYHDISKYFTNQVDDFHMTIQNLETKALAHFKIDEKRDDTGTVNFNLVKLDKNFDKQLEEKMVNHIDKLGRQTGGRRRDDSSSDSSSSSDSDFFRMSQPINRFVYFYMPYYQLTTLGLSPIDQSRIFLPMFSLPINPSLEIRFDIYKYFV